MRHGVPSINADMGESFGIHSFGNDVALLNIVDAVNVACGMHAGDPSTMHVTVLQSLEAGVSVGAHPGLPDLVGFGRRSMAVSANELRDLVRYQVGALKGFIDALGGTLHHIKPHGAMFGMVARDEDLMNALCDVAVQYEVPIFGLAGTVHEKIANRRNVPFIAEFYVDMEYQDDGMIRLARHSNRVDQSEVHKRVMSALSGSTVTGSGKTIPIRVDSFCVHSDLPGSVEVAMQIARAITESSDASPGTGQVTRLSDDGLITDMGAGRPGNRAESD